MIKDNQQESQIRLFFLLQVQVEQENLSWLITVINEYLLRTSYDDNISVIKTASNGVAAFNIHWPITIALVYNSNSIYTWACLR